jgi:hypothetical protein
MSGIRLQTPKSSDFGVCFFRNDLRKYSLHSSIFYKRRHQLALDANR